MMPTVTIECGGAEDGESDLIAYEGLLKYIDYDDVLTPGHSDLSLEFFHNPLRLELLEGASITYAEQAATEVSVTLIPEIEHFNFGFVTATTKLGYVSGKIEDVLTAKDARGTEHLGSYFQVIDGCLYPRIGLKLFMVTTNPEIASNDCLFYLVEEDDVDPVVEIEE
jgi:hypothetical protein